MAYRPRFPPAPICDNILVYNSYYFQVRSKDLETFYFRTFDGKMFDMTRREFVQCMLQLAICVDCLEKTVYSTHFANVPVPESVIWNWYVTAGGQNKEWHIVCYRNENDHPQILLGLYSNYASRDRLQPPFRASNLLFPYERIVLNLGNRWTTFMGLATCK